jgi:hypothetical protein
MPCLANFHWLGRLRQQSKPSFRKIPTCPASAAHEQNPEKQQICHSGDQPETRWSPEIGFFRK